MSDRSRPWQALVFGAYVIGLFVAFYLYVRLRIQPELFRHQFPEVFLPDARFFVEGGFATRPGGLLEYACAFLAVLFTYGWVGTLVVTGLIAMVCLAFRHVLAVVSGTGGQVLFLVPAVLLLAVMGQYVPPVPMTLGVLVVLLCVTGALWVRGWGAVVRGTVFVILSAVVYVALGGALYVQFALLCGLAEFLKSRHVPLAAFCLLCAVAVPGLAGAWLFDLNIANAYGRLTPGHIRIQHSMIVWVPPTFWKVLVMQTGFLLWFPMAMVGVAWRGRAATDGGRAQPVSGVRAVGQALALGAVAVGAAGLSFDRTTNRLYRIASATADRRWDDLIDNARHLPAEAYAMVTVNGVNRALYFQGRLLDDMFRFPQTAGQANLVYYVDTFMAAAPMRRSDVLFDLGRINEAHHMAYEALENYGDVPRILRRLVRTHVLKGEPAAARVVLALLQRSLLDSGWARRYRQQLDADPVTAGDPEVASRRGLMMVRDIAVELTVETLLQQLLHRNPRNRMAFEYLMAHYLLERQVDKLVANVHRFRDFHIVPLPRHCQEAIAIHMAAGKAAVPEAVQRAVCANTRRRYAEFLEVKRLYADNSRMANAALHRHYSDSYFLFYEFGVTGGEQFGRSGSAP